MAKFAKKITFEGINELIREAIVDRLQIEEAEEGYLDEICEENDIRLLLQLGYHYKNECEVGYTDEGTSANICDAILEMYENTSLTDEEIYGSRVSINLILGSGSDFPVGVLELKEYVKLTIVNRYGIETDVSEKDFSECVISAVDTSLNNDNLQYTKIYRNIFGDENTNDMDDDEYNDKYNQLIDNVLKSIRKYMLCDSGQRFNFDLLNRFVSGYFAFEIPEITDAYIDDICDVLYYEDR